MAPTQNCKQCNNSISADAPGGTCPSCMMALGMANSPNSATLAGNSTAGPDGVPRVEQLASHFPKLEIQHLIGHGGMGAVYQARQKNLDRIVALKILSPRLGDDPSFTERFMREARTLAKLSHPNIVTVFDFGQTGDQYYLIMEFIDGVNLRDVISANSLSPKEAIEIVPQICEALQFAHDQGVVHRDIKPENILLTKGGQVKIADFGLAKLLEPSEKDFTLTGTRQVLGTLSYMAPEQIEKPESVDHRADLYSLGVVFYELLTGELPLGRFSIPSEKSSVSERMDDVVLRTLEKEPDRRYQQASQLKTAVDSLVPDDVQRGTADDFVQHTAANDARTAETRADTPQVPSVPFTIDNLIGGFAYGAGLVSATENDLNIEFEVRDGVFDAVKSTAKTVSVPLQDISSIRFKSGFFSDQVIIQSNRIDSVKDVPGSRSGSFTLQFKKRQFAETQNLVAYVSLFCSGQVAEPNSPRRHFQKTNTPAAPIKGGHGPSQQTAQEKAFVDDSLRIPRIGLTIAGWLNLVAAALLIFTVLDVERILDFVYTSPSPEIEARVQAAQSTIRGSTAIFTTSVVVLTIAALSFLGCFALLISNRIRTKRNYGLVMCGVIMLLLPIPSPGVIIALPCSIWLLILLFQSSTRMAFRDESVSRYNDRMVSNNEDGSQRSSNSSSNGLIGALLLFLFLSMCVVLALGIIAVALFFSTSRKVSAPQPPQPIEVTRSVDQTEAQATTVPESNNNSNDSSSAAAEADEAESKSEQNESNSESSTDEPHNELLEKDASTGGGELAPSNL